MLLNAGRLHEAETYVRELFELAAGDDGAMANAMRYQSRLERDRGHLAEAVEIARDAVRRADRSGIFLYRSRCLATYWERLYGVGDLPGAAKVAEQTVIVLGGDRPGPVPLEWASNACNFSELLLDLGRWQDAHRQAAAVLDAENVPEHAHIWARRVQMLLCARQGTDFTKGPRPDDDGRLSGKGSAYFMFDELVEAELRRAAGDLAGARTAILPALELEPPIRNIPMAMRVLAMGAAIEADSASEAGSPAPRRGIGSPSASRNCWMPCPPAACWTRRSRRPHGLTWLGAPVRTTMRCGPAWWRGGAGLRCPTSWVGRCSGSGSVLPWLGSRIRPGMRSTRPSASPPTWEPYPSWTLPKRPPAGFASGSRPSSGGCRQPSDSTRELEVLRLLADGATNGDIAQQLFMSPKTASVHVSHVIAKLGVANRTQLPRRRTGAGSW